MKNILEVALVISAFDRATRVINQVTQNAADRMSMLEKKQQAAMKLMGTGAATMATGVAIAASLAPAVVAFSELEASSATLESQMLKTGGVTSKNFAEINKRAEQLGNALPGTTADFQDMMGALLKYGVQEKSILDGAGKSAAYLGVALKLPYQESARITAKLKEATGTADKDLISFIDTIARLNNVGVDSGELSYAFSRSAGQLKLMKVQGLEASQAIAAVYASLIKNGASGETTGTNMSTLMAAFFDSGKMGKLNAAAKEFGIQMQFVDKQTGEFKGVENMIAQFDKMQKLNPAQRADVVRAFVGPGMDAQFMNTLIDGGTKAYTNMRQRMAEQANLDQKVAVQLRTLSATWEATTGTFTNALAALGSAIGPELTGLASFMGKVSEWIQSFAKANPNLFKFIGLMVAFVAAATTAVGLFLLVKGAVLACSAAFAIMGVASVAAFWWVGAIAAAAALIYVYWRPITKFFSNLWQGVKNTFKSAVSFIFGQNIAFRNAGASIPKMIANGMLSVATLPIRAIAAITKKMRAYLPFSPAKEGAFMDLHKVKIVETIASGMRPGPLVNAMRRTTGAALNGANTGARAGATGGGGTTLHFAPVINVNGGGPGVREQVGAATEELKKQFQTWYNEAQRLSARRSFSPNY